MKKLICALLCIILLSLCLPSAAFADAGGSAARNTRLDRGMNRCLPTEAYSSDGTRLTDIRYNADGTIASLNEWNGQTVEHWVYRYCGGFLYRVKNIGSVPSSLSAGMMPGTDLNYSALSRTVYDCVGFTLDYQVTKVRKGDGIGDRCLYVYDGYDWFPVGTFAYNDYRKVSACFSMYDPITIVNFTTPRICADDSSFMIEQSLRDILVADYTYVCPDTMEPLISCYQACPGYAAYGPGPADLAGQDGVTYPHNSWLADYEAMVVRGTTSGNAYLRWSPDNAGREYLRYVSEGEWVTVIARESGYSLVLTRDGRAGWVTSRLLSYW